MPQKAAFFMLLFAACFDMPYETSRKVA